MLVEVRLVAIDGAVKGGGVAPLVCRENLVPMSDRLVRLECREQALKELSVLGFGICNPTQRRTGQRNRQRRLHSHQLRVEPGQALADGSNLLQYALRCGR